MKIHNFKSKVTEVKKITEDSIYLTLTAPEDFAFEPGQFITLKIENKGETKPRAYSILSAEKGQIKLAIKLIPSGFASEVFAKTKVGDEFAVKGPLGHFVYDEKTKNKEFWFLGGGTGVVPLACVIKGNLEKHPEKKFVLLFSARTKKDLFLDREFKDLEQKNPNFIYMPTLTRAKWEGRTGRINQHFPKDLKNKTFYICGTKELVTDVKKYLLENDVDTKNIKIEQCS